MVNRADLDSGLRRLGVEPGDFLEVHSSLSSFGRVVGGAATVVDALVGAVGQNGAILMPVHPCLSRSFPLTPEERVRGIRYKCKILPESEAPAAGMGAIADEFLRRDGVKIGPGMHRVAAWGRDRDRHLEGFHTIVDAGGKGLMLGTKVNVLSAMHIPEQEVGVPREISSGSVLPADILRDYPEDEWYVECMRDGRERLHSSSGGGTPGDGIAWCTVWDEGIERGMIRTTRIGKADCHGFRLADLLDIFAAHLRTDPWTLYGVAH